MRQNRWVATWDQYASWIADLSPFARNTQALIDWTLSFLVAGEQCSVLHVESAPSLGYQGHQGEFADFAESIIEDRGAISVLQFDNDPDCTTSALMAFYDESGEIAENYEGDLGRVLTDVNPRIDRLVAPGRTSPARPLRVRGPVLNAAGEPAGGRLDVQFFVCSNIWYPWVDGLIPGDYAPNTAYSNHMLANRHTPRLNLFLEELQEITLSVGGRWHLGPEIRQSIPGIIQARGIDIDAPLPSDMTAIYDS